MSTPPSHPADPPAQENRLAREASPYLIQHKDNPVAWWPWGPEALAEAKRTGKPILLSVGYAACHWCHVMAHESFEDEATARVMNELFVNIKVDREERPDVDQIYMTSLHLLGEQGGWPLTMFLTPDAKPVWGGTYFPKDARYGRPAFTDVLREVARLFREEPDRIARSRDALMARLAERARPAGRVTIGTAELDRAARGVLAAMDSVHGGLRGAPKFPQCAMLEFLWRAGSRGQGPHFEAVELTLERMSQGGIYDHLRGGYSRYSVDERWLVPHFEKMLYDNAQILELLALAFVHTGSALYRDRARETVAWLEVEMVTAEGGFASSLDADSEGEEGKFYVWSYDEIIAALGPDDAAFFAQHYGVSRDGNFEGENILNRLNGLSANEGTAKGDALAPPMLHDDRSDEREARLAALQHKLLMLRNKRVRPGLDDKVLADWNGMMIAALIHAGTMLGEPAWFDHAKRAFAFVTQTMTRDGRLGHSWREGRLVVPGLASDYSAMGRAALALFEATGDRMYFDWALRWQEALEHHYANPDNGGYFLAADDADDLVVRPDSTVDDATPNPNGVIAQNLVRLALLSGDERWRERADRLFDGLLASAAENLFGHLSLLNALDLRLRGAEIIITGEGDAAEALLQGARALPFTERIVLHAPRPDALPQSHPARANAAASPEPAAFICRGGTCSLPVTNPADLATMARSARTLPLP